MSESGAESFETQGAGRLAGIAKVESYLALAIALLALLDAILHPFPVIPRFGQPADQIVGITLLACGFLLSISGARHSAGHARIAARVSLAFYALVSAMIILASLASFGR